MCGINAVDLYNLKQLEKDAMRLEYNRAKTSLKRVDDEFISIKIVKEARPLLRKYVGSLCLRYSTYTGLDTALSKGMKQLCKIAGLNGVTFYWARHSFASIARNECRFSKDDIALALNHIDNGHRVTDIYIAKDWTIVDEVQASVITTLLSKNNKPIYSKAWTLDEKLKNSHDSQCVVRQLLPRSLKTN